MLAARALPDRVNQPDPIINVYIEFDAGNCPTEQQILDGVVSKLLKYDRLGKVPFLDDKEHLHFETKPYNPRDLIRRIPVPAASSTTNCHDDGLLKIIESHLHDPLNAPKTRGELPWWEIIILESPHQKDQKSVCLWRIHHALGDGISLATVAQQVLQFADGTPFTSVIPRGLLEKRESAPHTRLPWYRLGWKLCEAAVSVLAMPWISADHDTLFSQGMQLNMVHSHHREIVLFPTLSLEFVKAIKNAANVSINDVLFTCLSQAIRNYLEEMECPILKQQGAQLLCRALIAAVLPRPSPTCPSQTLLNKWFLLSSDLGVGISPNDNDILERLHYLHDHLGRLKTSPLPMVGLWIQNFYLRYLSPRWLTEQTLIRSLTKRSLSISNVPGPPKVCLFAGQPATGVNMFLSNLTPHVTFLSYAGNVFGSITLDPVVIPHAQSLSRHYLQSVLMLARRLRVDIPLEFQKQQPLPQQQC